MFSHDNSSLPMLQPRKILSAFIPTCCRSFPRIACSIPNNCQLNNNPLSPVALSSALTSTKQLILTFAIAAAALYPVLPSSALGVRNGLLTDCQSAGVSCVSSQDDKPSSFLEPWEHDEDLNQLQERLINIVLLEAHTSLVAREPRYLRFEIALSDAAVDDLEFFFPDQDNIVHFRSARRDGSFDFLQNRRRMDSVRQRARLVQIPVLRNRVSPLIIFETPFDAFGPSAVSVDALIENKGLGTRPIR